MKMKIINKFAKKIPDNKKTMLTTHKGIIYQKYVSKMDRILTFLFRVEFFHLVWEHPDGERYYE